MIESAPWKWTENTEEIWTRPSEDVYYLLERWKSNSFLRFLDLGCGLGRHALFFAKHGFSVSGFDLSPEGVDQLNKNALEQNLQIETRVGDMLNLPYADNHFDCLLSYHSLYHTDTNGIRRALSEVARVLRPSGEAYITFNSKLSPSYADPDSIRIDGNTLIKTNGIEANVPHFYVDYDELKSLLSAFEIISLRLIYDYWKENLGVHFHAHLNK